MRASKLKTGFVVVLLALATSPVAAQVAHLEPSDYGAIDLPQHESLGGAVQEIEERGDIFEPIVSLPDTDPIRQAAKAIVRLDVLSDKAGKQSLAVCTASVVRRDLILTNYHCIPGVGGKVEKASIVLDYLRRDSDEEATRLVISTEPVAADEGLDYAFVRIVDSLPAGVKTLALSNEPITPGRRLVIVHHPAGRVKMMTQYQCATFRELSPAPGLVRHICDTLPGSSGGILFDPTTMMALGLHHDGGLRRTDPTSFNQATALSVIRQQHPELFALSSAASQGESVGTLNHAVGSGVGLQNEMISGK